MATAFAKAGRKGPQARLHDHAIEALDEDPQNFQAALGIFLGSLSKDAGALNALIGGDKVRVRAGEYLHDMWLEHFRSKDVKVRAHARGAPGKDGGHGALETQRFGAAGGGGQLSLETHTRSAPAALSPERIAGANAAAAVYANSILRMIRVNGLPIAECTVEEVWESAQQDERLGRFKRKLCEGVAPSIRPYMVIGDIVTDDEAESIWEQTQ